MPVTIDRPKPSHISKPKPSHDPRIIGKHGWLLLCLLCMAGALHAGLWVSQSPDTPVCGCKEKTVVTEQNTGKRAQSGQAVYNEKKSEISDSMGKTTKTAAENACSNPACSCNPCTCDPCRCDDKPEQKSSCNNPDCSCDPCICDPCNCTAEKAASSCLNQACTCNPCTCIDCKCS